MPGTVPNPTPVIHMTHLSNLAPIIAGGLRPVSQLQHIGQGYTNIAYSSIQQQRATKQVSCSVGGCLHDYVPFYFTKRSPMLYTINRGNVECDGGQDRIVHLVTTAQHIEHEGYAFAFTDGHGIMSYTEFFDDLEDLPQIDWNIIDATYWHDTAEDGDRKRRKQAEFLVHGTVAWEEIKQIVVRSDPMRDAVAALLAMANHQPAIAVRSGWYY